MVIDALYAICAFFHYAAAAHGYIGIPHHLVLRSFPILEGLNLLAGIHDDRPRDVEWLSGACLMLRREALEEVGRLSERWFMYAEDFDLCFKIHQAGYKIYYVPQAELVHHGGGSSKRARNAFSSVQMRKAVCQFLGFRRGRLSADLFRAGLLVSSVVRLMCIGAVALLKGQRLDVSNPVINKWFAILRWSIGLDGWSRAAELRRKSTQVGSTTPF